MDVRNIDGFDWDAGNARKSGDKHGVTQVEAEQASFNLPVVHVPDVKHSEAERRFHGLGKTNDSYPLDGRRDLLRLGYVRNQIPPAR